jgi:hypothetical protein
VTAEAVGLAALPDRTSRACARTKRIDVEIGNGGFGPGYGLIGLTNGAPDDQDKTAPAIYDWFRGGDPHDASWEWPAGLLPICHWGCAILSCVDCADPNFRMRIFAS